MQGERDNFLRKLRQIEEHAGALTHELGSGEAQSRARLICGLAARLDLKETADPEDMDVLQALRQIEEQAERLARMLPAGLPLHRVRQIKAMAAHLALQTELEKAGGHLHEAANDGSSAGNRTQA